MGSWNKVPAFKKSKVKVKKPLKKKARGAKKKKSEALPTFNYRQKSGISNPCGEGACHCTSVFFFFLKKKIVYFQLEFLYILLRCINYVSYVPQLCVQERLISGRFFFKGEVFQSSLQAHLVIVNILVMSSRCLMNRLLFDIYTRVCLIYNAAYHTVCFSKCNCHSKQ